jgi:lysophospholipase L1-like esterase
MKTILCYGDSNTWGYDARTKTRFPPDVRWPGLLRSRLGSRAMVIEEGLNGRTTVLDDPVGGEWKNGLKYLLPCLESHAPVDLVILMLGTNDLKMRFSVPASDIAIGIERLILTIKTTNFGPDDTPPQILLLAPPPVVEMSEYDEMFTGALEKSKKLGAYYRQVADLYGCAFLDTSQCITCWDMDGIHISPQDHEKLGTVVSDIVEDMGY